MALLRIIAGENKDLIYPLESEKLILGRDSEDIPILDQGVSRSHAEIFRIGEMYFIRDLGSRNGTFVNDRRIDDQDLLRAGDHIHLGNTELVFEDRFARDQDSRIVRFSDVVENQGSTLSIQLSSDEHEGVQERKTTKGDEHHRLQTLYRMSRILGTGEGMEETMHQLAEELSGALNADHVYIFAFEIFMLAVFSSFSRARSQARVTAGSARSLLLRMEMQGFLPRSWASIGLRLEWGKRASSTSITTSIRVSACFRSRRALFIWPGNQLIVI